MWKRLFILLFGLIAEPDKTWRELSGKQEENNTNFYKSYLYPIFGMIALLSFVGVVTSSDNSDLQTALKTVIKQITVYVGGFYITSFVLTEFIIPRFKEEFDKLSIERFLGYASSLIYAIAIIQSLFPSLFFLQILVFYSVYIIWAGTIHYLNIEENSWVKFTVISCITLLFIPTVINFLMNRILHLS
jgi:hypothetical protein